MPVCRSCGHPLTVPFIDLGEQPLANAYLDTPDDPDPRYPLRAFVCAHCLLVQADTTVTPAELFSDYAFFSGASEPWFQHCRGYAIEVKCRFGIGERSRVIEVASNDGTLISTLAGLYGPEVLGIEPAANIAEYAEIENRVPTISEFFTAELAADIRPADLVVANNVLGHVPDLNDFTAGLCQILKPNGVLTVEVPWLGSLIEHCQFDTIYAEHYSYFSVYAARNLFERHGLRLFDVEPLPVHGGSVRLFACRADASHDEQPRLREALTREFARGLDIADSTAYAAFQSRVDVRVGQIAKVFTEGRDIGGAGAPAKGNTLLNAAGVTVDQLAFTTDTSPHKQGRYLPGSHVPIYNPSELWARRPEFVFVLAWNWAEAIIKRLAHIREWGGKFIVPVPKVEFR